MFKRLKKWFRDWLIEADAPNPNLVCLVPSKAGLQPRTYLVTGVKGACLIGILPAANETRLIRIEECPDRDQFRRLWAVHSRGQNTFYFSDGTPFSP